VRGYDTYGYSYSYVGFRPLLYFKLPAGSTDESGYYTEESTIDGGETGHNNPKIPAGFKPIDEGTAIWGDGTTPPTAEAVNSGLVIENKDGSQYVWIPVDGVNVKLSRYTFSSYSGAKENQGNSSIDNGGSGHFQETDVSHQGNTTAKDIEGFKTSVAQNGGYYIGRYEASQGTNNKAVSKKDKAVWNRITQPNAAIACQDLYEGIESDLINSYAWDTAIVFLQKNDNRADKTKRYSLQTSLNTSLKNTGASGDVICNIYDMASNCWEWTTETYNPIDSYDYSSTVKRGGRYRRQFYLYK